MAPPRAGYATAPGGLTPRPVHEIPGLLAEIHLGSRNASPARRNPHELNPREPVSHNARRDDITESKSPGAADGGTCTAESGCNHIDSSGAANSGAFAGGRRGHTPTPTSGAADGGGHGGRQAREMAPWEDRSVPHPTAPLRKPRNHAKTVEPTRSAGANDPPRAPKRPPRTHQNRPATDMWGLLSSGQGEVGGARWPAGAPRFGVRHGAGRGCVSCATRGQCDMRGLVTA